MSIGGNIKRVLQEQGRSVTWLQSQIETVNINTLYGYLNRDRNKLDEYFIYKCALYLDVTIDDLVEGVDPINVSDRKLITSFNQTTTEYSIRKEVEGEACGYYVLKDLKTLEEKKLTLAEFLNLRCNIITFADWRLSEYMK